MSPIVRKALGLALLLALLGGVLIARLDGVIVAMASQSAADSSRPFDTGDSLQNPLQEEKRLRALNVERQKSMVKDADKLLKLAHELDEDLNLPTPGPYNQADYSKVTEIEKLAHRVKDKMTTSVARPTAFPEPSSRQQPLIR
jgi:hypothetical protein